MLHIYEHGTEEPANEAPTGRKARVAEAPKNKKAPKAKAAKVPTNARVAATSRRSTRVVARRNVAELEPPGPLPKPKSPPQLTQADDDVPNDPPNDDEASDIEHLPDGVPEGYAQDPDIQMINQVKDD